jgi:hypothetical protein
MTLHSCTNQIKKQNNKLPKTAKWIGGKDGGYYFVLNKILSPTTFHFTIYNDYDSSLVTDTIFVINKQCSQMKFDSLSLLNTIDGFDGNVILLKNIDTTGKKCSLIVSLEQSK